MSEKLKTVQTSDVTAILGGFYAWDSLEAEDVVLDADTYESAPAILLRDVESENTVLIIEPEKVIAMLQAILAARPTIK